MAELLPALIDPKYGPTWIALVGIFYVLFKIVVFVFGLLKKESDEDKKVTAAHTLALQENTVALKTLGDRMHEAEQELGKVSKLSLDVKRYYTALKLLAKDEWPKIRDIIEEEK